MGKLITKISSGLVKNKVFPELQYKSKYYYNYGGAHISRTGCQNPPLLGHEEL